MVGGKSNIVESDDRHVFRNAFARKPQGLDRADGRDVVEGKERGKGNLSCKQALSRSKARLVCRNVFPHLDHEDEPQFLGRAFQPQPR